MRLYIYIHHTHIYKYITHLQLSQGYSQGYHKRFIIRGLFTSSSLITLDINIYIYIYYIYIYHMSVFISINRFQRLLGSSEGYQRVIHRVIRGLLEGYQRVIYIYYFFLFKVRVTQNQDDDNNVFDMGSDGVRRLF